MQHEGVCPSGEKNYGCFFLYHPIKFLYNFMAEFVLNMLMHSIL